MSSSRAGPMNACRASDEAPQSACRTEPDWVSRVGLGGLLAPQFDEDRLGFRDAEQFRALGDHGEIAGCELIKGQKTGGRLRLEETPKTCSALLDAQRQESDLQTEASGGGRVELFDQIGGAGEGQGVVFHPGEHFIHL